MTYSTFGTFLWGDGTLYGVDDTRLRLNWAIQVDWDDDTVYSSYNEAFNCIGYQLERGREFFLKPDGSGFEEIDTGELTLTLDNRSGRYDPLNASGPLYGLLEKNQAIIIRVRNVATGQVYPRFQGYIEDIRPQENSQRPTVRLKAKDISQRLKVTDIATEVATTKRYNEAMEDLLNAMTPVPTFNIGSTVSDTMPYWWGTGQSVFNQIQDLNDAVLGRFYIDASGIIQHKPRVNGDASVITLDESEVQDSFGIRIPIPRDTIRNRVRVYARSRTESTGVELWRMGDVPSIPGSGGSVTVWANFNLNEAEAIATAITTPVATTDYTANDNADGSGTDRTGSISIVMTKFANAAKLVITNSHGSAVYLTLMKLRGDAIIADNYTYSEDEDTTSIATYGDRPFIIKTDWLQDINSAADQANVLTIQLAGTRKFPRIQLRDLPAKQFTPDLFDLVSLEFTTIGLVTEQRVSQIRESWIDESGDVVDTYMNFEPNLSGNISGTWIFPAVFGISTVFP